MSAIDRLVSTDDWVEVSRAGKLNGNINPNDNSYVKKIVIALLHSAVRDLFHGPTLDVWFEITNAEEIQQNSDPSEVKFKIVETSIINGKNYNATLFWFLKDNTDNVCSLRPCCDILGMDYIKVRKRVEWIDKRKKRAINIILGSLNQKDRVFQLLKSSKEEIQTKKEEVQTKLKNRIKFAPKNEIPCIKLTKTVPIDVFLKQDYKDEFDLSSRRIKLI